MQYSIIFSPALVAVFFTASVVYGVSYRTVAMTGTPAPGAAPDDTFWYFGSPALNDAGKTAFQAKLSPPDTTYHGIWSEGSGSLQPVALASQNAPGTPAEVTFVEFSVPNLNDVGQTAFYADVAGEGIEYRFNSTGIWSEGSGPLKLIARAASPTPGEGHLIYGFSSPEFNRAGQTAFYGSNGGGGGVWAERGGTLQVIAVEGAEAPDGLGPFWGMGSAPAINDAGQTAFTASLFVKGGVWSEKDGKLHAVALEGWPAPGMDAEFDLFPNTASTPGFNNSGQTAFHASIKGPGVDPRNDACIWSEGGGALRLVAREGTTAPGSEPGLPFLDFRQSPQLNVAGEIAFWAQLKGSNEDDPGIDSLWFEREGSLRMIAREEGAAPGAGTGVVFDRLEGPYLNDSGHVAFVGYLKGPGVDSSSDLGIWFDGPLGLELIVRTGDLLKVGENDYRTVSQLRFVGADPEGYRTTRGLNNHGQLAFSASFTDGTNGVFVATPGIVPEPAALLLGLFALAIPWRRRTP